MAYTLTVRLDDDFYAKLAAASTAQDTTLSDLARRILAAGISDNGVGAGRATGSKVSIPASLPTVQRHQLGVLHQIAAQLADDPEQQRYHRDAAEVFNNGYVADYGDIMQEVTAELTASDAELVMDVLDMFTALQSSIGRLGAAERQSLSAEVLRRAEFFGFDLNSSYESRLLGYARHLLAHERWTNLAEYFDREHERGNSHMRAVPIYQRMLAEFQPIWQGKIRELGGDFQLTAEDIRAVTDARTHPDYR